MRNPKTDPNAFAVLSVGGVTAAIISEAHLRFGIDFTDPEIYALGIGVSAFYLFIQGKCKD